MKIQKLQQNQQAFGTIVKFYPETEKMLHRKGADMYYLFDTHGCWLQSDGHDAIMTVSHYRKPHKKTMIVANMIEKNGDKVFISSSPVESPITRKVKLGDKELTFVGELGRICKELREKLIELKDVHYHYKLFPKERD